MMDVTAQMVVSAQRRNAWSAEAALDHARAISAHVGGGIDWDRGAGEEWIRVLLGTRVVSLVSTALPVGFLLEECRAGTDVAVLDAELILVEDMSAGILTCTRDAVVKAFGDRAATSPALDIECFSAEDLWFVTVS